MKALTDNQINMALEAALSFHVLVASLVAEDYADVNDEGWPEMTDYIDGRPERRDIQKYMLAVARKSIEVLGKL